MNKKAKKQKNGTTPKKCTVYYLIMTSWIYECRILLFRHSVRILHSANSLTNLPLLLFSILLRYCLNL